MTLKNCMNATLTWHNEKLLPIQSDMCDWLDTTKHHSERALVGYRRSSKSLIAENYVVYELLQDPTQSFLWIDGNPSCRDRTRHNVAQWLQKYREGKLNKNNAKEIRLSRAGKNIQFSCAFHSIHSKNLPIADHIIVDHLERKEMSSKEFDNLKKKQLPHIQKLFRKSLLYVGTPSFANSIYKDLESRLPINAFKKIPYDFIINNDMTVTFGNLSRQTNGTPLNVDDAIENILRISSTGEQHVRLQFGCEYV